MNRAAPFAIAVILAALAFPALATDPNHALPSSAAGLSLIWGVPFAGLLLSIALVPLFAHDFWHAHFGKVAAVWVALLLVPSMMTLGVDKTAQEVVHAILLEYLPFLIILFALFTIAGGICLRGTLVGTPPLNAALLALGAALASLMGTTGASMLLIRPLLSANATREHKVHLIVFFILLVGNVGGSLTPLGDPPLFIGFLKGVDFFWTTRALAAPTLVMVGALLAIFLVVDGWFYRKESLAAPPPNPDPLALEGSSNFVLLAAVVGAVLMSGLWDTDVTFDVYGTTLELPNVARDVLLVALALLSLKLTPAAVREHNAFHWAPIVEVAKLFAAIFVTITPVIAILGAGRNGALGSVISLVVDAAGQPIDLRVFWTTGLLSALLDNAPTYLVFFNLAGGDPAALMGPLKSTLLAISMAAVYFGALTYVGNAPNFMIKAIAEDRGVAMPAFFTYFAYAAVIMVPLLIIVTFVFL